MPYVNLISRFDAKGLNQADSSLKKTSSTLGKFGKIAGAAFAAAGAAAAAYAGKLLIDGVKAAIEDQKSQEQLATALRNTTKATDKQIAAVEDSILQMSLASGVADDQLRPSFQKLVQATGDVTKAQKLQKVALDVAAGSGKSLESVSTALAKAQMGNFSALTRLGVPLDENIIKTKDMDGALKALSKTFGGQADAQANTFAGKMQRMSVAFDEAKETVGGFILDALMPVGDWLMSDGIPKIGKFADELGKTLKPIIEDVSQFIKGEMIPAILKLAGWIQEKVIPLVLRLAKVWTDNVLPALEWLVSFILDYVVPTIQTILEPVLTAIVGAFEKISKAIEENKANFEPLLKVIEWLAGFIRDTLAPVIGAVLGKAFEIIGDRIAFIIKVFGWLIKAGEKVWEFFGGIKTVLTTAFSGVADIIFKPFKTAFNWIAERWNSTIGSVKFKTPDWLPGDPMEWGFPKIPMLANGGIVTKPTLAMIGEAGAEAVIPLSRGKGIGGNVTINISGAIDPEGTARQIRQILRRSELRAGAF